MAKPWKCIQRANSRCVVFRALSAIARKLGSSLALLGSVAAAAAGCPGHQTTFLSCQIEGRETQLRVCYDEAQAYYAYGALQVAPELAMTAPHRTLDYTPWPGVGRTIWETVTFHNAGYSYRVYGGLERMFEGDNELEFPQFGSVSVLRGEDVLAELSCDPSTVDFNWSDALFRAKQDAGLVWDPASQSWRVGN